MMTELRWQLTAPSMALRRVQQVADIALHHRYTSLPRMAAFVLKDWWRIKQTKTITGIHANGVPGVFSVQNALRVKFITSTFGARYLRSTVQVAQYVQKCAQAFQLTLLLTWLAFAAGGLCAGPEVERIIERSVKANQQDWTAAPGYSFQETDRDSHGSKTFRVVMIDGSPYQTLLSVNGRALTPHELEKQHASMETETARRRAETQQQRERRIAKYQTERSRDHLLMQQLTNAFTFRLAGERKVGTYHTYYLKATPRKGYQPPNLESEVLPGMEGELWIDKETFQWVKVSARVIRPVSIAGFLAQVEPGTLFELENTPVAPGIWLPKHYVMKSRSKILYFIGHDTQANETYVDYRSQVSP